MVYGLKEYDLPSANAGSTSMFRDGDGSSQEATFLEELSEVPRSGEDGERR